MNTTYTANENCFLIDGEVCIFSEDKRTMLYSTGNWYSKMGIGLLPRDKFVKPKDVEALARRQSQIIGSNGKSRLVDLRFHFVMGFKAGHNANPNEFTIDHLKTAWAYGVEASGTFQDLLKIIIPLSLPGSLEINEQGEIVNVIW